MIDAGRDVSGIRSGGTSATADLTARKRRALRTDDDEGHTGYMDKKNGRSVAGHTATANGTTSAIHPDHLKRLEKSLSAATKLGHDLSSLGRQILREVRVATNALTSLRQTELPLAGAQPSRARASDRKRAARTEIKS